MDNQICKVCNKTDYFNFYVPDKIWEKIAGEEFKNHVICLPCFDKLATKKNICYAKYLKDFIFVGEKAYFTFEIISALDN